MKDQDKEILIEYRMKQAGSAVRQAEILASAEEWSGVVNRAYYAMFYAALALLLTKGLGASKHSGVLALVDREFVRPGKLPVELSKNFRDAFNQRQQIDYAELVLTSGESAGAALCNARAFVEEIRALIQSELRMY